MHLIDALILQLKSTGEMTSVFNPWWQSDPENDISPNAPAMRRDNLKKYLGDRLSSAEVLFLGEALGYQGGHFSGLAMTSERILLGNHQQQNLNLDLICSDIHYPRTSNPEKYPKGFNEPTATIIWQAIFQANINPRKTVIWNAFPWHPYKAEQLLSNRTPTEKEMEKGLVVLKNLIGLFNFERIVAVGKKAEKSLINAGIQCVVVRHPANGGATLFRNQFKTLF